MANVSLPKNILIVRTDRVGDVVLSLPMIPALRLRFPQASLAFLLRSYTRDLVVGQAGLDRVLLYDSGGIKKPFFTMLSELTSHKFEAVVVTYPTLRLALLVFLAGIPRRVGTGYRWYSFMFTDKVFEHRKTAEKHEAEYNLSLLKVFGSSGTGNPAPRLSPDNNAVGEAELALKEMGVRGSSPLIILHPGSGGSARDWRPERFGMLAGKLAQQGMNVVVSGGPGEESLTSSVAAMAPGVARLPRPLSLMNLAALIQKADVFVSNSTGPLHIAAAVGTPVVAFYPPIRQCSSARWGPLTDRKIIFEPKAADCPRCKGGACEGQDCMDLIGVNEVAEAVRSLIRKPAGHIAAARS